VSVLNSQIDQATGTFKAKATFANKDGALWPGQSVSVRVHVDTLREVVTVPEEAVQRGPQGAFAFVVGAKDEAERRKIVVARQSDGLAVLREGVAAGDRVVTGGASRVQPGSRLEVSRAPEARAPAPADEVATQ
jgi:multidrug efflux system membrane fusion protein